MKEGMQKKRKNGRKKERIQKRTEGINEGNKARRKNVMQERITEETQKEERGRLMKRDLLQNEDIAVPTAVYSACPDNCCNSVVSVRKCRECVSV
jgi:hypothetical protein